MSDLAINGTASERMALSTKSIGLFQEVKHRRHGTWIDCLGRRHVFFGNHGVVRFPKHEEAIQKPNPFLHGRHAEKGLGCCSTYWWLKRCSMTVSYPASESVWLCGCSTPIFRESSLLEACTILTNYDRLQLHK